MESGPRHEQQEDGFYEGSFSDEGKFEDIHGEGAMAANLPPQRRPPPSNESARFGRQFNKYDSEYTEEFKRREGDGKSGHKKVPNHYKSKDLDNIQDGLVINPHSNYETDNNHNKGAGRDNNRSRTKNGKAAHKRGRGHNEYTFENKLQDDDAEKSFNHHRSKDKLSRNQKLEKSRSHSHSPK